MEQNIHNIRDLGIRDIYDLKNLYEKERPDGHYFDEDTLKFFGEKLNEMYLYKKTVKRVDPYGEHECYAFSSLQRNNPNGPTRRMHYLDVNTLEQVD